MEKKRKSQVSLKTPKTRPVDVKGKDFQNWYKERTASLTKFFSQPVPTLLRRRDDDLPDRDEPRPRPRPSPLPEPTSPGTSFHAYTNSRQNVDWNTCGQAAIATMLDYHGRDPFRLPRDKQGIDGKKHWNDGAIIDKLKEAGWGPDVVFGWGTTGGRITDALHQYGLNQVYVDHSGLFSAGWEQLWDRLKYFLRTLKTPVPVLVDVGALGGEWYTAHWPVAYTIGSSNEIYLANCPWKPIVDQDTFLHAWHCNFMPLGFNHCAVFYWAAWG